jgi:anaerobic C4-dicarboxylate transporter
VILILNIFQVSELKTDNEYQMRLKDISLNEKVKAINDNFQRQIEEAQARYEKLFQEKNQEVCFTYFPSAIIQLL